MLTVIKVITALLGTGLASWYILSCCSGSKLGAAPQHADRQDTRWVRVVVPDDWRGLAEFITDRGPTSAGAIEVAPNEHGLIYLPQPNPLHSWHTIEVRTRSGSRIQIVDPTDPQSAVTSGVIAMVSGSVGADNRVFLYICDAHNRDDFDGAVRRAIGFHDDPGPHDHE